MYGPDHAMQVYAYTFTDGLEFPLCLGLLDGLFGEAGRQP